MKNEFLLTKEQSRLAFIDFLQKNENPLIVTVSEISEKKRVTYKQQCSVYLYCEKVSDALNSAGIDKRAFYESKKLSVPWNKESVKKEIWNYVMQELKNKSSVLELGRIEVDDVYHVMDQILSNNFNVSVNFPSSDHEFK